jgi:viroplasmin and RNaseH domain-containing protein
MKQDHESQYLNERLKKNPSMLKNLVRAISEIDLDNYNDSPKLNIFDPWEKIKFNKLKENVNVIKEYYAYQSKINILYNELEDQGSIRKTKLLKNIKLIYNITKGRYVFDNTNATEIVQNNSDKIFNEIYDELYAQMQGSDLYDEDIALGIRIIMVDAFIRCKILEEPTNIIKQENVKLQGVKNDT